VTAEPRPLRMRLASGLGWLDARPIAAKLALLGAGYVLAFLVASGVVAVHVALTLGPDRDLYGGMHAFGDLLLFLVVFGAAAIAPTAASVFLLRHSALFWAIATTFALALAATYLASVAAWFLALHFPGSIPEHTIWEAITIPVFVTSPFLFACFLGATLAAAGAYRFLLALAAAMQGVCASYALVWLISLLLYQRSV